MCIRDRAEAGLVQQVVIGEQFADRALVDEALREDGGLISPLPCLLYTSRCV